MKLNILLPLSALVATTLAQSLSDLKNLPGCATDCVAKALPKNCIKGLDLGCGCKDASFLSDLSCCLAGKGECVEKAKQEQVIKAINPICSKAGVTSVPTAIPTCPSSASSASAATKTGTTTTQTGTTTTNTASSTSATTSSTNAAATGWKDSSLVAAAGAAAAFAVLV